MCWWVAVCVGGSQCVLVGRSVCWWVAVCVGGSQCVLVGHSELVMGCRWSVLL